MLRNPVAGAYELCSAQGEKISELGVWPMVHYPIGFHGNYFAVRVRAVLELDKKGRALSGISDVLIVVISEKNRHGRLPWRRPRPKLPWSD